MSREIDRQIAELLGYASNVEIEGYLYEDIPEFSTDWNAMRDLVEWLRGKRISAELYNGIRGCDCTLFSDGGIRDNGTYSAETAPLALCKAVLSLPKEVLKSEA